MFALGNQGSFPGEVKFIYPEEVEGKLQTRKWCGTHKIPQLDLGQFFKEQT